MQLRGLMRQHARGSRQFLRRRRMRLCHLIQLLNRLIDLIRAGRLLRARRADFLHEFRRFLDIWHQRA